MEYIPIECFVLDKALGYYYVYMPEHELANGAGKIYMHRYIAAMKIGRPLLPNEHAHHIDGNKENNTLRTYRLCLQETMQNII